MIKNVKYKKKIIFFETIQHINLIEMDYRNIIHISGTPLSHALFFILIAQNVCTVFAKESHNVSQWLAVDQFRQQTYHVLPAHLKMHVQYGIYRLTSLTRIGTSSLNGEMYFTNVFDFFLKCKEDKMSHFDNSLR